MREPSESFKSSSQAFNDLSTHPADKSAYVPHSLSSSAVISEEIDVDVDDDVFNEVRCLSHSHDLSLL